MIRMKRTLALFDFDHTLYQKDSLIEFTLFSHGKFEFYKGLCMLSPVLIGLKLGLLNNEKVKVTFLKYFFKNAFFDDFQKQATRFSKTQITQNLDPKMFEKFLHHIEQKHEVYIVTASCPDWIQPWCDFYKVQVIGTKLEVVLQRITGNISTKNCYGIEKVNRIKEVINLVDYDIIHVYGSGKGDREMLQLSKS